MCREGVDEALADDISAPPRCLGDSEWVLTEDPCGCGMEVRKGDGRGGRARREGDVETDKRAAFTRDEEQSAVRGVDGRLFANIWKRCLSAQEA